MQYFRPSLSYYLLLRSLFCLFLSGRLRQGLLYICLCSKMVALLSNLIMFSVAYCHHSNLFIHLFDYKAFDIINDKPIRLMVNIMHINNK